MPTEEVRHPRPARPRLTEGLVRPGAGGAPGPRASVSTHLRRPRRRELLPFIRHATAPPPAPMPTPPATTAAVRWCARAPPPTTPQPAPPARDGGPTSGDGRRQPGHGHDRRGRDRK